MKLHWRRRTTPLPVEGLWAPIAALPRLGPKLLRRLDPGWRGCGCEAGLVLLGPAERLPWVEGLTYLGREAHLYLPVHDAPDLPLDWLRFEGEAPWLLLPPLTVVALDQVGPLDAPGLRDYLKR